MRVGSRSRREVGIAHARKAKIAVARLRANLVPDGRHEAGEAAVPAHLDELGAELARVRAAKELELETVARDLHIQIHYLTAIEDGRVDRLPGDAYARGFLRAYADYLDLDSDRVLAAYDQKPTAPPAPPTPNAVSLPRPEEDSRRPSIRLITISILAVLLAVGIWQLTAEPEVAPQEVPPPPDHLSALLPPPLDETPPGATPAPDPQPAEAASPVPLPPSPAATESASRPPPASAETVAREAARDAALLTGAAPAGQVEAEGTNATPVEPVDGAPTTPGLPPIPTPRPDIAALLAHAPLTPADVPAPPPLAETTGHFGVSPEEARVVLKARTDAWVQVQDAQDKLLLTRILKAGESYHAPDVPGLVLTTGNLGGLEIIVDGEPLGSLGKTGEVRRNLPLDVEGLQTLARQGG